MVKKNLKQVAKEMKQLKLKLLEIKKKGKILKSNWLKFRKAGLIKAKGKAKGTVVEGVLLTEFAVGILKELL